MPVFPLNLFNRRSVQPPPTRVETGTSYETKGAIDNATIDYNEIGSQLGGRIVDLVPELGNRQQARRMYTKMVRADASVRVSLRAGKAPVLGAEFYVDPFSNDPEDLIIQELVEFNLFKGMTTSWLKFLEQGLKMFENGFSAFEPVWELREWSPSKTNPGANTKRYTMLRKLGTRPAQTVSYFDYDENGGPVSMCQQALRGSGEIDEVHIPIQKLCVFTFDQDGGDLEGNSILRSAYQHWYYKDHLYKIDAIQKERHGIGVPEIELQPGYSEADKRVAHELGRNLRTNERAYIVRTSMMNVGFAELSGNLVDALKSAEHHDGMIMKNVMVEFLNSGTTEGGGNRATSATQMDMFLKAMRYIAEIFCEGINLYVIPNLVTYNFKTRKFPQLQVRNIGEAKDLQMWAAAMSNLKSKGLLQIDDETEQWIRKQMQMPKRTTAYEPEEPGGIIENIQKRIDVIASGQKNGGGGSSTDTPSPPPPPPEQQQKGPTGAKTGNVGKSPSSGE